ELGRKEAEGVVAPVASVERLLEGRQQLDRGDAQLFEVVGFLAEASVGAVVLGARGRVGGEALHVYLVQDEVVPPMARPIFVFAFLAKLFFLVAPRVLA